MLGYKIIRVKDGKYQVQNKKTGHTWGLEYTTYECAKKAIQRHVELEEVDEIEEDIW